MTGLTIGKILQAEAMVQAKTECDLHWHAYLTDCILVGNGQN